MSTIKWIMYAIGKRKWMVLALGLLQSLTAVCGVIFALAMRSTIDCAVDGDKTGFLYAAAGMVALIVVQIGFKALSNFLTEDTRAAVENSLRRKVFAGILKQEYRRTAAYHTGELMNRITSDSQVITNSVVTFFPNIFSMVTRILGVLVVMYFIQWKLTVVFFAAGCVMAACSMLPRKWLKKSHKKVQEADGNVRSFLQEALESLLIIHTFGCEKKMENETDSRMVTHRRMRRKKANISNLFGTGLNVAMQCGYMFGFIWCGVGILHGTVSYGTLTAVIQLIGQIQAPFVSMGAVFPQFASMLASAERLMEITEGCKDVGYGRITMGRDEAYEKMESICFEDISFGYDEEHQVLRHDTFSVDKGEFAALIGSSGVGKSTVMKLLLSVYEPDSGSIYLKFCDGNSVPVSQLPKGIFAYVPQGNHLMSGTIKEVVGFAEQSETINQQKVVQACKTACAHDFIMELPQKYDTMLGERGTGLSEGQMQRLAVARAIYSGCPVLLLDEATSALDAATERRLISSLRNLSKRTVFLVTHRKEVWEMCDRVLERKDRQEKPED